jgi:hypothetical protein
MGNQLKLLRFSQCYGIGGGFWEISKGHKPVRYYMAKRIAVSTPPLYHNVLQIGDVVDFGTLTYL